LAKEKKEPVLSYSIGDEEHTLYESDITPMIEPLYNKVSATLKLQRIIYDFLNDITDEKINALHHLVHNSEGKK
jgi:hypothetical protein